MQFANSRVNNYEFDDQLLKAYRSGDSGAIDELFARHQRRCYLLALRILRNAEDAEDAVQSAFTHALEHLCRFEGRANFVSWLTRIVVNDCLMSLRRTRRRPAVVLDEAMIADFGAPPNRSPLNPEQHLQKQRMEQVLMQEIRRIPPLFRSVLVMHHLEQKELRQVARELGTSVAAAKSRLHRARRELKSRMARYSEMPPRDDGRAEHGLPRGWFV